VLGIETLRGRTVGAIAALVLAAGCSKSPGALEAVQARHQLNVATLNSPTTYYQGAHGPQGAEFQLATAFAAYLGVDLNIYTVPDVAALRQELRSGRADLVAAGITPDAQWSQSGRPSSAYADIPQLVVGQRGKPRVRNIAALAGKRIVIARDTPQLRILDDLRARGASYLQWEILPPEAGNPLALVSDGKADFAVVDANAFLYAQHLFPGVAVAFTLPDPRQARWFVGRHATDLLRRVNAFLDELRTDNGLEPLLAAAAPESPGFELQVSQALQRDIAVELPTLHPYFEEAARDTGVDWRLLAALGYAESKWHALAASVDGAEGVMMLTHETATKLGVTNRGDARQNILAGARYFVMVREQIPDRIPEPDRTWFTLAAYNMGYGHLEDARKLAQSHGHNPDLWADVREALPLLAREEYYPSLKHGYARGWEPVQMVDKVQLFLKLLEWQGEALATQPPARAEKRNGT
jgi:membrane-bound lytic murein transglycosylase F